MNFMDNILSRFVALPLGNICDANGKGGNMDYEIKPIDPKSKMVGLAFTVKCHPGDNLAIHKAIYEAPKGSVLVVDAGGYCHGGHFGEIMAFACQKRGIVGLVIDGACRDAEDIETLGFPVFARGLNPGGTIKETIGITDTQIICGRIAVKTGDIVVGGRDGVIIVPAEQAEQVLEKAEAIAAKEINVLKMLDAGMTIIDIYKFDKLLINKECK